MCVVVGEGPGYSRADCSELRPGGNRILPTEPGADAPGAAQGSKLPYSGCRDVPRGKLSDGRVVTWPVCDGRSGRFLAEDRVQIAPPAHSLFVAEENWVEARVRGAALAQIRCDAQQCVPANDPMSRTGSIRWKQVSAQSTGVEVFPTQLGKQEYKLTFLFADGGVAHKTLTAEVALGTKKPRAINTSCGNDSYPNPNLPQFLTLRSPGKDAPPARRTSINACYDGITSFVELPPAAVQHRVLSDGDTPVIRVDEKTGEVTPLRAGEALLERSYAGLKTVTCFVVWTADGNGPSDLANCRRLRAQYGAPLPALQYKAKPTVIVNERQAGQYVMPANATYMLGDRGYFMDARQSAQLSPEAKERFDADDRLEIPLEGFTATLGQVNRLPIRLQGPEPLSLSVTHQVTRRFLVPSTNRIEEQTYDHPYEAGQIVRAADGSLGINLYPLQTGRAIFHLSMEFVDGGVAKRTIEIPVQLPAHTTPHLFNALEDDGPDRPSGQVTVLHLLPGAPRALFPFISFDERKLPIPVPARDVSFSVQQASDPVIRLDAATGIVTPMRLGHALIRMHFDGAQLETCAVVMAKVTEGDPSTCEDLRQK